MTVHVVVNSRSTRTVYCSTQALEPGSASVLVPSESARALAWFLFHVKLWRRCDAFGNEYGRVGVDGDREREKGSLWRGRTRWRGGDLMIHRILGGGLLRSDVAVVSSGLGERRYERVESGMVKDVAR